MRRLLLLLIFRWLLFGFGVGLLLALSPSQVPSASLPLPPFSMAPKSAKAAASPARASSRVTAAPARFIEEPLAPVVKRGKKRAVSPHKPPAAEKFERTHNTEFTDTRPFRRAQQG